jgi:hypothetical protein
VRRSRLVLIVLEVTLVAIAAGALHLRARSPAADESDAPVAPPDVAVLTASSETPAAADAPREMSDAAPPMTDDAAVLTIVDGTTRAPIPNIRVGFMPSEIPAHYLWEELTEKGVDPADLVLHHGRDLTADAGGHVRLPDFEGTAIVGARRGRLRGTLVVWGGRSDQRLELRDPIRLVANVRDEEGRPCCGARVLLMQQLAHGAIPAAGSTTGADGSVLIRDKDTLWAPGADPERGTFTVALPFARRPSVRVELRPEAPVPVVLTLPPFGRVRCEVVDETGTAVDDDTLVLLRDTSAPRKTKYSSPAPGEFDDARAATCDGVASFPFVGLDLDLEVEVASRLGAISAERRTFRGPRCAGQETVVRVVVTNFDPYVVGASQTEPRPPEGDVWAPRRPRAGPR